MTKWKIYNEDAVEWARHYNKKKFHALLCDPPYHLTSITKRFGKKNSAPAKYGTDGVFSRSSSGFMGQTWDGGDVAFDPDTWAAFGEVLYPGAFIMAFSSSRSWHRLAVAIEDAGFVIHPTIFLWAYGCLSEDTEILTDKGWKSYKDIFVGSRVVCYTLNGDFDIRPVQEIFEYDYNETAYQIKSEETDQIVSRNHRVIVERNGRWEFEIAEKLHTQETIPVYQGFDYLPNVRDSNNEVSGVDKKDTIWRLLLKVMQSQSKRKTSIKILRQWSRKEKSKEGTQGGKQSRLERWNNLFSQAWQLCTSQVRALSRSVFAHGSQRWICDGASVIGSTGDWTLPVTIRGGASYQSQPTRQPTGKSGIVLQQHGTQKIRTSWEARPDLATVTSVHYQGKVWCVKVPTGAFVARRNGKAFVTGNSGFPKATRIDNQIDKAAGIERKVIGKIKGMGKQNPEWNGTAKGRKENYFKPKYDQTIPATDLAKAFQGHRYGLQALKPACEPIIVAQLPYEGKPIDNIVETGAGALNIDRGRVGLSGMEEHKTPAKSGLGKHGVYGKSTVEEITGKDLVRYTSSGRWPANFILDEEAAKHLDEQTGILKSGKMNPEIHKRNKTAGKYQSPHGIYGTFNGAELQETIGDSGGASRFFYTVSSQLDESDPVYYCSKASRKERDAGLDEFEKKRGSSDYRPNDDGTAGIQSRLHGATIKGHNSHPTVKPIDLARYLAKLLLPPADYSPRRILVPFSGVASEMIGCGLAGWEQIVGVEFDKENGYIDIANARLEHWLK